ncbi:MAG: ABC transporter permease [Eubacteriales bacterium]|nr:ABC transporter permease [Eubacteriales bacterium]
MKQSLIARVGLPRIIIFAFLLLLLALCVLTKQDLGAITGDVIVRFGMNGILALSMFPSILCGAGLNFGVPIGVIAGLVGGLLSVEFGMTGFGGVAAACLFSVPIAVAFGYLYGKLLNTVKGNEIVVGNYISYAAVSLMCIFWLLMPFTNPAITWPIRGTGVRTTVTLEGFYDGLLNDTLSFTVLGVKIPTLLLAAFALACVLIWLFSRSKTGLLMKAAGENPMYAAAAGISVDAMRLKGIILSTLLAAVGIVIYSQSYGFYQLYNAPLNMAFAPVAAVLLGGATTRTVKIRHVIIGTFLFQAIITVAMPVANQLAPDGGLAEVARIIVSNGIILYALMQSGGERK